jgi:hypothetical protein
MTAELRARREPGAQREQQQAIQTSVPEPRRVVRAEDVGEVVRA